MAFARGTSSELCRHVSMMLMFSWVIVSVNHELSAEVPGGRGGGKTVYFFSRARNFSRSVRMRSSLTGRAGGCLVLRKVG